MCATLEIEPELDLVSEIIFQLRHGRGKCRKPHEAVDAAENDKRDENYFPLQIGVHGQRVERFIRLRVGLFRIFRCLHLRYRRTRDADFYLVGDLENHRVAVNAIDGAVDAAIRDDLVAGFQRGDHRLHLFALPLLRQNEHHVENGHHHDHHYERIAEQTRRSRSLEENRRHHRQEEHRSFR